MAEESLKQMRLFRETTAGNGRTETIIATEMVLTCSDAVKASYPGKDNHISGRNPYLSAQKKNRDFSRVIRNRKRTSRDEFRSEA